MRYLAALCILALTGCATALVKTEVGQDEHGHPYFTQEVSGKSKAVVEASKQAFHGTLRVDPKTGVLDIKLDSGQDAKGVQSDGLSSEAIMQILALYKSLSAP